MNPSGFAALEILCELHPDYVKIDRNDISDSHEKEEDFLLAEIEGSRH
ncbi:EAL domain-containing protein [Bacillus sp. CMF21]|nr:EAL domain-containing protein [Bacillus sp. CMF21]